MRTTSRHVLLFFHGESLAHTVRPLVLGRALARRGHRVAFAGVGRHTGRVRRSGFAVHEVESMPQSRRDEFVARGDYAYYDEGWVLRCVEAELALLDRVRPDLAIGDMRPTLRLSGRITGRATALVEAGYNQPGYPFPIALPGWFDDGGAALRAYERRRAQGPGAPCFHLVADVPAFHPAGPDTPDGYRYVGPLIDTGTGRWQVWRRLLGWRARGPLAVLSLGSTGQDPGFAEPVVAALLRCGYRVLVLTAGRWQARVDRRVKPLEYAPLAVVLRRASLFVGIGGIGSIYHALRSGVPVIGAPEHLDQEYHLNRVRDLGLGVKLSWADFHDADRVVEAVTMVRDRYADYQQRCRRFAPLVRAWDGGQAAAEVVEEVLRELRGQLRVPPARSVPATDFVRELEVSTPDALDAGRLRAMLAAGVRRGLPCERRNGSVRFDRCLSWNWLYDHDPGFFEADYEALDRKRQRFFRVVPGGVAARLTEQRYRLTYRYRACWDPAGAPARVFLPWPLRTPWQTAPVLIDTEPEGLGDYLLPRAGFFYGVPVQAADRQVELAYTCQVTVRARDGATYAGDGPASRTGARDGTDPGDLALSRRARTRYLQVNEQLAQSGPVQAFLESLDVATGAGRGESARQMAEAIYRRLSRSHRFHKTTERCQCLGCSTAMVLGQDGAHCITLSRAFIALCRLAGVPAREVTGALAGYPVGPADPARYEIGSANQPLFGHTWAEVFVEEDGWLPVEFHGIVIGPQAMTPDNVADEGLRRRIEAEGEAFEDYYFGRLDCHRVYCSGSVKKIPQLVQRVVSGNGAVEWRPPPDLHYACHLTFEVA